VISAEAVDTGRRTCYDRTARVRAARLETDYALPFTHRSDCRFAKQVAELPKAANESRATRTILRCTERACSENPPDTPKWYVVPSLCTVLAFFLVLLEYQVSEQLFGIDGIGGPYS
jgi:hypothetical protein